MALEMGACAMAERAGKELPASRGPKPPQTQSGHRWMGRSVRVDFSKGVSGRGNRKPCVVEEWPPQQEVAFRYPATCFATGAVSHPADMRIFRSDPESAVVAKRLHNYASTFPEPKRHEPVGVHTEWTPDPNLGYSRHRLKDNGSRSTGKERIFHFEGECYALSVDYRVCAHTMLSFWRRSPIANP